MSTARKISKVFRVGVVAPSAHPVLSIVPDSMEIHENVVEFLHFSAPSTEAFDKQTLDSVLYIPPGEISVIESIWKNGGSVPWIHCFFAGVDTLMPFLKGQNLVDNSNFFLSNGRSAFSESLAEFSLAAMLHFNKQIPRLMENKTGRNWDKFKMEMLTGSEVTFVGFGHIAQTTARLLQKCFDIKVNVLKRSPCEPTAFEGINISRVVTFNAMDRDSIYETSDYIICSLPGTEETFNFVSDAQFSRMKESAVFISNGRGMAVDEEALIKALKNGSIAGAALDVFKIEPLPDDSELWKAPNLLISPHNADLTDDYFQLGWKVFLENLQGFIETRTLKTPVNKNLGY